MEDAGAVREVQALFLRWSAVLRGFILALVPDFNDAEDVFQEVFLTLTAKASDFKQGTNFLAWARAIARLKVLEHHQRKGRSSTSLGAGAVEALIASAPEFDDSWGPRREALRSCLDEISPRVREIMELRYNANLPPPRIAARVSWSVGAVHVALARARKFLRDCARQKLAAKEA